MMNFKFIVLLLVTPLFCLAVNEINEPTGIDPDLRNCTKPVTPVTICLESSDLTGDNAYIAETITTFNCSIEHLNDTCFIYRPLPGLINVTDTINVKACTYYEPVSCNELTVLVDVKEVCGDNYNANNDVTNSKLNEPVTINILENDENNCNTELEDLVISLVTTPANGVFVINADRTITYTPNEGFTGQDNFEYLVCCSSACDVATATVNVVDMFANDDFYYIMLENENSFNVLSNDEIEEKETYNIAVIIEEENPYISITANSPFINVEIDKDGLYNELNEDMLVWYPDENSSQGGTNNYNYSFKYAVCNSNSNCDTSKVTLSIVVEIALSNEDINETYDFELYPNPVDDILFISNTQLIQSLQIYESSAKLLYNKILNQRTNVLNEDISFLQNGLYFISLQLENDQQIIQKIYKR